MKTAVALMTAFLLASIDPACAMSLLKNSSFEIPLDPDNWGCDQPAQWIRWGSWLNRETDWAPTQDGKCLVGFHHWRLKGPDNAGLYQDVRDVEPGKRYKFSVHVWCDKGANADSIALQMHSFHGGTILTQQVFLIRKLEEDEWQSIDLYGKTPDRGVRVAVVIEPKPAGMRKGAIKLDNASLTLEHAP